MSIMFVWGIFFLFAGVFFLLMKLVLRNLGEKHFSSKYSFTIGWFLIFLSLVSIGISSIRVIPAGTVGVVDLFGRVYDRALLPGLNLVNPLARVVVINARTEEMKEIMVVPSNEGLSINMDVSILYHIIPNKATEIYRGIGPYYRNIVILPQFRSVCRGVTVNYEAKALYTSSREEIAQKIFNDLAPLLEERGIILEKVLLRGIGLPPTVSQAIEMKLKAEQEAEQMKFILEKEKKEAQRRIIEAEGIAKAQEIINKTLTPQYLQHEAIQAQIKMADSPNHTTVYIPVGDNGIPLVRILNNDDNGYSNKK